jgi:23S rRNA pseudouridine955/2504/2580 synthase
LLQCDFEVLEKPMSEKVEFYTVSADEVGQRLDNYLMSRIKGVPKSLLYRIIRKGEVRVNKGRAKPDRRLLDGDSVRVPPLRVAAEKVQPEPGQSLMQHLEGAVIYDQDGLLVINKPSGLAVHGGSGVDLGLIEALRQMPGNHGFLELVHRLDRDTSGCIMIARKRSVLKGMQDALRERQGITKTYVALTQGVWPKDRVEVDVPLQRYLLANGERMVRVHTDGKSSKTRFKVVTQFQEATLVEAIPISGRTHQIRVHAAHVGCPLVGDNKYGDTEFNRHLKALGSSRLFLHAKSLCVSLPDQTPLYFEAPLPSELELLLARLS